MNLQTLLKAVVGLSILATPYADAAPAETYKAAVIADCSNSHNCPLIGGDILWNDENARSVLPLNKGMLFLGTNTRVQVINLTSTSQEFSLLRGKLALRIWKNSLVQKFKIRAGNLMISMKEAGFYQIEVSPNGRKTMIQVISGSAEIRIGKLTKVLKTGQSFSFNDNRYPKYTIIKMPAYDDQYYFSLNFIRSYYRMHPVDAPSADLTTQNVNGPNVEIIYYPPVTIYNKPLKIYHRPVIVREPRFKSKPVINVDINLDKTFGERKKPEMPKPKAPKPEVPKPQSSTPEMPGKQTPEPEVPAPKRPEPEAPRSEESKEPEVRSTPIPEATPESREAPESHAAPEERENRNNSKQEF